MSWQERVRPSNLFRLSSGRRFGALLVCATAALGGCKVSDVSREGPVPAPTEVQRVDANFPTEAVVCTDVASTLEIRGTGFSPLPVNTLREDESLALPKVRLSGGGQELELAVSKLDVAAGTLTVALPAKALPAGTYDVLVDNPNGQSGTLSGSVRIVPPPTLTAIAPDTGTNGTVTPVALTGTELRSAGDGTLPRAFLSPVGGTEQHLLTGIALESPSQLAGSVPGTVPVGRYDVTVRNPEGCQATLPDAFEVVPANDLELCSSVTPGFGWVQSSTTIEICGQNANGKGLKSTPEVFIVIGGQEIPLRREAYLSEGTATGQSLMSAVVPSQVDNSAIVVGGPYAIKVVNPDGKSGTIPNAFEVLADPPPRISAISPGRGDKDATVTLTVTGQDFKDPVDGTPVLAVSLIAASGTEHPCGATTVTQGATAADPDVATCQITLPSLTGGYVVRAKHTDDGSFDDFALFAVTESSRKLAQTTLVQEKLNVRRRAHGIAMGQDDLGNRFLYVVGGEAKGSSGELEALTSGEFATVSRFGELGPWRKLEHELPAGRTGMSLVRVGRFVYAIGGSTDGTTPVATDTVLRAHILGADSAPVLAVPTADVGGTLQEGTYYYRVSAVMDNTTVNPGAEGLASDMESIKVPANGTVRLSWTKPTGADVSGVTGYRIYRSPQPNLTSGTELLLATTTETSFVDTGSATPAADADYPLRPGTLGVWVPVAGLATPRFDAAATSVRLDANNVFIYVAGGRSGGTNADVLNSTEEAVLTADGKSITAWRAGPALTAARAEHVLRPYSRALAETVPAGEFGILASGGTQCSRTSRTGCTTALGSLESGPLQTGAGNEGKINGWTSGGSMHQARVGHTGMLVNNSFYAFNGWGGSGGDSGNFNSASEKSGDGATDVVCVGSPCALSFSGNSSATMSFATGVQYRAGTEFYGAYFYFVGGSASLLLDSTSDTVLRGSY